jgi:hypothetical protein
MIMHDTKNIFSINNSDYEEPDETIQPSLLFLLFQNRLPRWLSHDIPPLRAFSQSIIRLLECHCEQLPSTRELSIKTYFDGIEAITRKLYPLLFLGIWGYDQYNYWLHSQNRYLMTLPDLLLGIPRNYHYEHAAFATNLG